MDGIQLYSESQDALSLLLSTGIVYIVGLVLVIAGLWGGSEVVAQIRAFAPRTRKYVDQPGDVMIRLTELVGEMVTHKDVDPQMLIKLFTGVVDALGKQPETLPDNKPVEAVK